MPAFDTKTEAHTGGRQVFPLKPCSSSSTAPRVSSLP